MDAENNSLLSRGCCNSKKSTNRVEPVLSHKCCKMDTFDWLKDIELPQESIENEFYEIRFKNNRKDYFRNTENVIYKEGDFVAVESSPGHDIGIVTLTGRMVILQMKKKKIDPNSPDIKKIYRRARLSDVEKWLQAINSEPKTMAGARQIATDLNLDMKINDVEYQGDKTKAYFYYTANVRVDFREMIKVLAERFYVRVEMRQIGARQEASRLGGIGSCGRELCCSTWIADFKSVSTNAARYQQLSSNPQRLTGQCNKLKCCLNYEADFYMEALKSLPDSEIVLQTKKGDALHQKTDVIKKIIWYTYKGNDNNRLFALTPESAFEIIEMNKNGKKPDNLEHYAINKEEEKHKTTAVLNEDDITRFD